MSDASLLLTLYRVGTMSISPLARAALAWRRLRGKEDPLRLSERLGFPSKARPSGPLAWLHGASVGESLVLMTLAPRLTARGFHVLITTGTITSANLLGLRLPAGVTHQFVPLDAPKFWRRFLDHWRPDLFLLAESELWPNMLLEAARRQIPVALVNARMSERSFARWRRAPSAARLLLTRIDVCLAQSQKDAERFTKLGARRVLVAGNIKYDAPAPPVDAVELAALSAAVGPRPVWLAASTHSGEESAALAVHATLAKRFPNLLTIIAPRHADRGEDVAAIAAQAGARAARRSLKQSLDENVDVYIADTMGEAGLYYRLAGVVFVGKSLTSEGGGQNPIEPAKLGGAVLHGPHVANFADVYADLDASGGARSVKDVAELTEAVRSLLSDVAKLRKMARAAAEAVERVGGAADAVMRSLEPWMPSGHAGPT